MKNRRLSPRPHYRFRNSPRRVLRAALVAAGLLALPAAPAAAQMAVPDTFTNLKVLPKNVTKPELLGTMRAFSQALGVRCDYCHARAEGAGEARPAGAPGGPPERLNFASDDKEQKRIARGMLRMVGGINGDYLAKIAELTEPRVQVRCMTCHHGVAVPRTLADVLLEDVGDKGAAAAVSHYRQLKVQYYGGAAYDFREGSLVEVARQLTQTSKPDDALAILELAGQEFPQSGAVPFLQGEALLQKGDKAGALARFQRALELQPQNEAARRRISELGGS